MAVTAFLALALTGCEYDSTSQGELVIAPEEPLCHPWPSCTSWTSDSADGLTAPTPAKATERVKPNHNVLADFEFSVTGESVWVRLKADSRYRLEYDGPEGSIVVRTPGRAMAVPAVSVGHLTGASGFRALEFTTGPGGNYEFSAGAILGGTVRAKLSRL